MKSFVEQYVPTTLALVIISSLVIAFSNMSGAQLFTYGAIVSMYMLKEGLNKIAKAYSDKLKG